MLSIIQRLQLPSIRLHCFFILWRTHAIMMNLLKAADMQTSRIFAVLIYRLRSSMAKCMESLEWEISEGRLRRLQQLSGQRLFFIPHPETVPAQSMREYRLMSYYHVQTSYLFIARSATRQENSSTKMLSQR